MTGISDEGYRPGAARIRAGSIIDDRYEIERFLGAGAFGSVYLASDSKVGGLAVALKVCSTPSLLCSDRIARFQREILGLFKVDHHNVVRFYDCLITPQITGYSMEYVEGCTLRDVLIDNAKVEPLAGLHLLIQLCAGLEAIHSADLIHRDLKPSNIMIDGNGSAKISDFGIVSPHDYCEKEAPDGLQEEENSEWLDRNWIGAYAKQVTKDGEIVGTPYYMSPEYIETGTFDKRADIYALGIIGYEIFSGELPFEAHSTPQLMISKTSGNPLPLELFWPGCPLSLSDVIGRAVESSPEARFQSAKVMELELRKVLEKLQNASRALSTRTRSVSKRRSHLAVPRRLSITLQMILLFSLFYLIATEITSTQPRTLLKRLTKKAGIDAILHLP